MLCFVGALGAYSAIPRFCVMGPQGDHSNVMEQCIRVNKYIEKGSDFGQRASMLFL